MIKGFYTTLSRSTGARYILLNCLDSTTSAMRTTRSMTSSSGAPKSAPSKSQKVANSKKQTPTKKVPGNGTKSAEAKKNPIKSETSSIKPDRKRKASKTSAIQEIDINELPHNLGKPSADVAQDAVAGTPKVKDEAPTPSPRKRVKVENPEENGIAKELPSKSKLRKAAARYGLTPGVSPFPDFPHPTPEECEEVNRLLSTVHGKIKAPSKVPQPSLTVTGCGEVPSVLDALIRTLLSGATTGANSARAFKGLVDKFGILESGIGKGSVNWNAVRTAPMNDVFQAMKSGGLATTKSKYIKELLNMVYEENLVRKAAYMKSEEDEGKSEPAGARNESKAQKEVEMALTDDNVLSLDWVHALDKEDAMLELIKYPGIGPKTAACVVLFCLQRPCFAVDTHIFRICKWLGWLPSDGKRVTEIMAFSHLEVRIPDHLKYPLHALLIRHGKSCPRCRAITGEKSEGWEKGCVIDHLVKRTGKRKGGD